jgi:hypothetical protein
MTRVAALAWAVVGVTGAFGVASRVLPAAETTTPGKVSMRNIVRSKLPPDAKVIGLEFTVLKIDSAGTQSAVDPEDHSFQIGDSFLVKIRPQDDVYVYVFTAGPQGKRSCLLPEDPAEPLLVKQGVEISLPEDGGAFTFEPPAGEEKLVVVALKEPNSDLDLLASAAFEEPGKKMTDQEQEQQAQADAAIDGLRQRGGAAVRLRGGSSLEREVSSRMEARTQFIVPPDGTTPHSEVVGVNASEIIVDIPLRSEAAAGK